MKIEKPGVGRLYVPLLVTFQYHTNHEGQFKLEKVARGLPKSSELLKEADESSYSLGTGGGDGDRGGGGGG